MASAMFSPQKTDITRLKTSLSLNNNSSAKLKANQKKINLSPVGLDSGPHRRFFSQSDFCAGLRQIKVVCCDLQQSENNP